MVLQALCVRQGQAEPAHFLRGQSAQAALIGRCGCTHLRRTEEGTGKPANLGRKQLVFICLPYTLGCIVRYKSPFVLQNRHRQTCSSCCSIAGADFQQCAPAPELTWTWPSGR